MLGCAGGESFWIGKASSHYVTLAQSEASRAQAERGPCLVAGPESTMWALRPLPRRRARDQCEHHVLRPPHGGQAYDGRKQGELVCHLGWQGEGHKHKSTGNVSLRRRFLGPVFGHRSGLNPESGSEVGFIRRYKVPGRFTLPREGPKRTSAYCCPCLVAGPSQGLPLPHRRTITWYAIVIAIVIAVTGILYCFRALAKNCKGT